MSQHPFPNQAADVTVVSPHLDDAALSLGATIAWASGAGLSVTVLNVFAGDPEGDQPAGEWDRACGFATAGEAASARRAEEEEVARVLGTQSVSLPLADEQYAGERDEDEVWAAMAPWLESAGVVLVPGFPLAQEDHRWLTSLVLRRGDRHTPLGLYVEQPYAVWESVGARTGPGRLAARLGQLARTRPARRRQRIPPWPEGISHNIAEVRWHTAALPLRAYWRKARAIRAYQSQLRGFGPGFTPQLLLYAWTDGGEPLGWIESLDSAASTRRAAKPDP